MRDPLPHWVIALLLIALVLGCLIGYDCVKASAREYERERCGMAGVDCSPFPR